MTQKQYAFHVDTTRCIGCRACEIACKQENQLEEGQRWRRVRMIEDDVAGHPTMYFLSMACNHCENPICVTVCPAAALQKREDGIVLVDESRCIGCRYCQWACPYDALHFNANTGRMSKCTMCVHRVDVGQQPACVVSCPTQAIEWGPLEEIAAREESVDQFDRLPDPTITSPAIRFKRPRLNRA